MLTAQTNPAIGRLLDRLHDARKKSDALFDLVRPHAIYARPIPERHRIVFYIGHLEAFDWNLLHDSVLGLKSFHADFDRLFAFGIDPLGGGLPADQPSDWPSLPKIREYVGGVRAQLDEKLSSHDDPDSLTRDGIPLPALLNVAIEHRLMHLETLAYMLHQLPVDDKIRPSLSGTPETSEFSPSMLSVPAGSINLGLPRNSSAFGWDNEFESHVVHVPEFQIDRYMVTNGQFLKFLRAGGYAERSFWTSESWNWKESNSITHPVFWKHSESGWLYCTMFEEIQLPADWPVYVSHAEASAYARWARKALPSEEQWQRAAYGTPEGLQRFYPWGDRAPNEELGNFDFHRWDPTPVNAYPSSRSAFGVEGMLGNGWEWTSSIFEPYAGFQPFPFYRGYSANFFDRKHFVMKGGSPRTAACMLRPTFRNWFQAHYQFVYAGFRCVNC